MSDGDEGPPGMPKLTPAEQARIADEADKDLHWYTGERRADDDNPRLGRGGELIVYVEGTEEMPYKRFGRRRKR